MIIQSYVRTDAAGLQDKENFYSCLKAVVDEFSESDIRICIDNFNAKNSSDNTDKERVMGRHGCGKMD